MRYATLLLLSLLTQPLPAHAQACGDLPPPSVTLRRIEEPVTLNTSYDYKSITVLARKELQSNQRVLGLTRAKSQIRFDVRAHIRRDRDGRWECVSPQITVSYGFSPMTVYVANEFPPGSCAYREIHAHELQHVEVYLKHLDKITPTLKETLNKRFATDGPWVGATGEIQARLNAEIEEHWLPFIRREIERANAEQQEIDSPAEYDRIMRSCNGVIRRVIR
ncbi:hypothetical protein [Propionivibrio limicola]|uniref:hypothetical protein n=1 Tax=Propionivibrio limicola TaxID=167645 RepID=UPI0012922A4C|nr:hypothetical protein [Propionivibrio limicola]